MLALLLLFLLSSLFLLWSLSSGRFFYLEKQKLSGNPGGDHLSAGRLSQVDFTRDSQMSLCGDLSLGWFSFSSGVGCGGHLQPYLSVLEQGGLRERISLLSVTACTVGPGSPLCTSVLLVLQSTLHSGISGACPPPCRLSLSVPSHGRLS